MKASANAIEAMGASVKLEFFEDLRHATSQVELNYLARWLESRLGSEAPPKPAMLEPDDDMSPEAAEVWRRLVAETEAEEKAGEAGIGEEDAYTPIDDTVVDLIDLDPDAALLTHKHRPSGVIQRAVYGCEAEVTFTAWQGEGDSRREVQHVDHARVVVGTLEIPDVINRALQHMTPGAKAEITSSALYAYGEGSWQGDLPGLDTDQEAHFDVELHSCAGGDVVEADVERANQIKDEGNALFKAGFFRRALHAYQLAKRDFDCLYTGSAQEVAQANAIRLPCILNIAACHQKLSEWAKADTACALALNIDGRSVKALFRRAQAAREFGDLGTARSCLQKILEIEPENKAVPREMALLHKAQKGQDKKAKGTYAKMFA